MKIILIIAVEEYEKQIKNILKHSGIKAFTMQEVKGFQNYNNSQSWFISDEISTDSVQFTIISDKECVDEIVSEVENFNLKKDTQTKIHLACWDIEKSI